ncbi:hypothetical protein BD410DRAFT_787372 [Rickenella mellea]|uniref:DUF4336 domain-containing protein n=1 Tax=Rickenella mellea TaxID=50990 RepID=A0A4Y7Q9J3_9AGAM|nr:hypothetical protein BD410DRAFT_787372 [Rickenella mellea]
MADIVAREVTTNVWTFSKPFLRANFLPFGGRSTAIKLTSGDVWILVSTPLSPETKSTISSIGPVKYLVAPDLVHNLYLAEYATEYPEAKVYGPPGLPEKLAKQGSTLKFTGVFEPTSATSPQHGYENDIEARLFSGHQNKEIAFLHKPSRTLIEADLVFNLPGKEQYSKSKDKSRVPLIGSLGPHSWLHPWLTRFTSTNKVETKRDASAVAEWDFDRIIPCHGDVIETDGKNAWKAAFSPFL